MITGVPLVGTRNVFGGGPGWNNEGDPPSES